MMVSRRKLDLSATHRVTLAVACFYLAFTLAGLGLHNGDPLWFTWVGDKFADLDPAGHTGYDGQFVYYLARDGPAAIPHLDSAPYRLQRILLPLAARLLAGGMPGLVPWAIILVNYGAIVLATYVLAQWLYAQKLAAWYALLYPLYVGTFMAYSRNLVEPLAFGLAALGTLCWLRKRDAAAISVLALAALTKETTLLFVAGLALGELAQGHYRRSCALAVSAGPLMLWEGYLLMQFRVLPFAAGPGLQVIPLSGIVPYLTTEPGRISALFFVALPALALTCVALGGLIRDVSAPALWILLLNGILVLAMPPTVYDHIMHAGRNAAGLVLATVLCLPRMPRRLQDFTLVYGISPTFLWLIPVLRWAPWLSEL